MKVIFDLDYTRLDTGRFKKALGEAFASCGISPERYEETYRDTLHRDGKLSDYDHDAHLDALAQDFATPSARAETCRQVENLLSSIEQYLFPEAVELLRALRRDGHELVLLTLGNEKWQRAKLDRSRLSELFDKLVVTGENKYLTLRMMVSENERAVIVNDNSREMRELMTEMPGCLYVLMKGPKSGTEDLKLPEVTSIRELAQYFEREGILREPFLKEYVPPGLRR